MATLGSLFAGAGGFELGWKAAGVDVAWQVEIDRDCVSVLERHWPDVRRYGDVRCVDPDELAPVDVVIFGSPCQDLSVAGKRAGMAGKRSGLFGEAIRVIRGLRPTLAFCVWETVPGALSVSRGRAFGAVVDALADCGALDIAWRVLDAHHFGVPQRRRRIFVVADFGGERAGQVLFDPASSGRDSAAGEQPAGDAENGVGVACFKRRGGFGYSESADVSLTLASESGTHTGSPMGVPLILNERGTVRRLTPRECERLQGWPDDHTRWRSTGVEIGDGARYRMIGNGVAAPVAAWIAARMLPHLE